ncbi:MAG: pyruvate, phosphate dikinase [Actinomycetota bacterium]
MATTTRADVVSFDDADPGDVTRLGGKGASLVEMRRLGLSVPPGFIISTDVCRRYLHESRLPEAIGAAVDAHLADVERAVGRRLGDPDAPLLVSVRSGAPVSMPGMMDTILDLGLCDATVDGLARATGDERFAWDCYVRLLVAYGATVRGIEAAALSEAIAGSPGDADGLRRSVRSLLTLIEERSGKPFPQDTRAQLDEAIAAVFSSWESPRAKKYRRYAGIDDDLGTAVVVQAMVFGNLGERSGTGVAFTRDPATGARSPYGDFLAGAQGDDVVAGEHDVGSLDECRAIAPEAFVELTRALDVVEHAHRDMCEIEFTVEQGRLWVLQSRVGQRTGVAAVRIATEMIAEGVIDPAEAITRIHPSALLHLRAPVLDPDAPRELIGRGVPASPGSAVGRVALTPSRAEEIAADGTDVILVRPFTSPDDVAGMIAARGIVTAHGGRTSHAAVVARGMDRPAVCGVAGLVVGDAGARFGATTVTEGDELSIDGSSGEVYRGIVPRITPIADPRVETLLAYCDSHRRIPVLAEAQQPGWADGPFDADGAIVCRSREDVERAVRAADPDRTLVIDPEEADGAAALAAGGEAAATGIRVVARVDRSWPAAVRRLPPAPWIAVVATEEGSWAARLLAATAEVSAPEAQ